MADSGALAEIQVYRNSGSTRFTSLYCC